MPRRSSLAQRLPAFPWDSLAAAKARAQQHPGGIVDLSVGTPVDPTPESVRSALTAAADWPGYPQTIGTLALRDALVDFLGRHRGAPAQLGHEHVLPTVGSKELVAHLPFQLGITADQAVAFPDIAYPTYDIGARFVGAEPVPVDMARLAAEGDAAFADPAQIDRLALLWLNSPSNPSGAVLDAEAMSRILDWARQRDVIVASDECYALLTWDVDEAPSILDPRVNGGDLDSLLCVYSLSKQSNLAGYRTALVAGDPELVGELTAIRKQAGMMLPGPVQAAMATALGDDDVLATQRERYRSRRARLRPALEAAGGRIDHSEAGLYLWTSFGTDALETVEHLASLGILCAPGVFYGEKGRSHVRIALTTTDERIDTAVARLGSP